MPTSRPLAACAGAALIGSLAACGSGNDSGTTIAVKAGDDSCAVADTSLDAGDVTFEIENVGTDVTEVYVYGKQGDEFTKIVSERENIGPGTSQHLDVSLAAGDYEVACKPGMAGDGIRQRVTVAGEGGGSAEAEGGYDRELVFEVTDEGTVDAPELAAVVEERIEFKLESHSGVEHYLELLDPKGEEVGEAEARGGDDAEFVGELARLGDYRVKVFESGAEDRATTFTLKVSANE